MKYDFTTIINRQGKDAMAVDAPGKFPSFPLPEDGFDFIPMWVADMNFATVPTVQSSIAERLTHPLYGYFITRDEYYQSIICLLYTSPSPRDTERSRMPSSA